MTTASRPIVLPETLAAGDAWRVAVTLSAYAPADGYTATLFLRGPSAPNLPGTDDGAGGWLFTLSAEDSAAVQPGTYAARIRVVKNGAPVTLTATMVTVAPNFETVAPDELLSHEEKCIPLLETAIQRRISVDTVSYTLVNRSVTSEQLKDMEDMLASYRERVRMARGGDDAFFRTLSVEF